MSESADGSRRWTLATVFSIVFLDQLGIGIIIPVLAPLLFESGSQLFGAPFDLAERARMLGLLIAAYPMAQFIGAPLLGALSDRHGRKPILVLSLAGTALGWLLFGIGIAWGNLWMLFLARALAGFMGGNAATANSAVADISDVKEKVRNFGIVHAAYGLGFIIGPYTGGKLSDPSVISWFSRTTPFWVAAGLTVANLILVAWAFHETLREKLHTRMDPFTGFRNVRKAFTLPNARAMLLVVFLLWFGFNAFAQFFQVYLVEYFGVTPAALGKLFAYLGIWFAGTLIFVNRWISRRIPARHVLAFALPALAVVVFLHLMPREFWMYYVLLPFLAMAMGLIIPNTTAIISDLADDKSQGEIIGIQHSMQSLALVVPPIVSGFIVAWHVSLPVVAASVFLLMAWAVYLLWFQRAPQRVFHETT